MKKVIQTLFACAVLIMLIVPLTVVAAEPESTEALSTTEPTATVGASVIQESTKSIMEINIPSEFLCSIISFAGVIASALISKNVSKNTAAKEIEKMELAWNREDLVSSEEDFSKMTSAVAKYASDFHTSSRRIALGEIASVRAKESGDLATALDQLYQSVFDRNYRDININLTNVINTKRELKCKDSSSESK